MRCARTLFNVTCAVILLASHPLLASELRIWVDVNGKFSVEARVESYDDQLVVLKRKDGGTVTVPIDRLSNEDKGYLQAYSERMESDRNPLREGPPKRPDVKPLPVLDLPQATHVAADLTPLQFDVRRSKSIVDPGQAIFPEPGKLVPDPAPQPLTIQAANIKIFDVDIYDLCSPPIAVTAVDPSGNPTTSIAMSISRGTGSSIALAKNQLIRFDIGAEQAYVSLNHHESIRLLDHNPNSDRSLVLTGFNSLGDGGNIAIATGWGPAGVQLSHIRSLSVSPDNVRVAQPKLRWAKWVDDEHFMAVIGESLGLWNIVSGRQVYQMDGIDHRSKPVLSGGRRYLAMPVKSAVVLYETATGKKLGQIDVERQFPGVSFSPNSDRIAITTSRRLRCWDLSEAKFSEELESRSILGTRAPIWIDSDLILSSSGVLVSLFRRVPIWRYELTTAEVASVGEHVVIFRKQATSELSCTKIPHPGAIEAIEWFDATAPKIDSSQWQLLGISQWSTGAWVDKNFRITAGGQLLR